MPVRARTALSAVLLMAGLMWVPAVAVGQTAVARCADVSSAEEAQAALLADPTDPGGLDADRDGIACETWDYAVTPVVDRGAAATSAPAPRAVPVVVPTVDAILAAIDALDCTDYQTQLGAIDDATFALPLSTSSTDRGRIADALEARKQELDYCFDSGVPPAGGGPVPTVDSVLAAVAALDCTDYETQFGAIEDAYFALPAGTPARDYGRIVDALNARNSELASCVSSDTVVPTADDGSTPYTSGEQVSVIPEGSAETGNA